MVRMLVVLLAAMCTILTDTAAKAAEFTVVFTAGTSGKFTGCTCPGDPYGGFAERVTFLDVLRNREKTPFLLVEAGGAVSLFGDFDGRSHLAMVLMNSMGYDALGAGEQELYYGIAGYRKLAAKADFPVLNAAATPLGGATGGPAASTVVTVNGVRIGIIGISDSTGVSKLIKMQVDDFKLRPAEDAVRQALAGLAGKADAIVVLSSMSPDMNRRLIDRLPAIDLVVEAWGNERYEKPVVTAQGVLVSPGSHGQFVGLVTLATIPGGGVRLIRHQLWPVVDVPADEQAMSFIEAYEASLQ